MRFAITLLVLSSATLSFPVTAQLAKSAPTAALLDDMAGRWDVTQRMWPAAGAAPVVLPNAVAERRVPSGGGFLEETMTLADPRGGDAFTRTASINYNRVDKRFEYASMDSRAPMLMHYRAQASADGFGGPLHFAGGSFVVPEWGKWRNTRFAYRLDVSPVAAGRQRVALYLRPLAPKAGAEFLAFEYRYVRR